MTNVTVTFKAGGSSLFEHAHGRYEGVFAIIVEADGTETAFPAADIAFIITEPTHPPE